MAYEYDVFVSYSRDYPFGDWVRDPFLPLFTGYLKAALNRRPSIFVDDQIEGGSAWALRLRRALAQSRCLVGIWSPNYFLSDWCVAEWTAMATREQRMRYRTIDRPDGLVVPVTVHDGEKFPASARAVQFKNWVDFARVGEGFKRTERFVEFQDAMSKWTDDVARVIGVAPDWSDQWLTDDWLGPIPGTPNVSAQPQQPSGPDFPAPRM
jgi:hypothetical protein